MADGSTRLPDPIIKEQQKNEQRREEKGGKTDETFMDSLMAQVTCPAAFAS